MQIVLTKNRMLQCDALCIGYCKENNSECLEIKIIDSSLWSKRAYLEFKVNNNEKYTTDALEIVNGTISYLIPNGILSEAGFLELQLVLRDDENNVIKSNVKKFIIDKSICAEDQLALEYPDFIGEVEKLVKESERVVEEIKEQEEFLKEAKKLKLVARFEETDYEKSLLKTYSSNNKYEGYFSYKSEYEFKENTSYLIRVYSYGMCTENSILIPPLLNRQNYVCCSILADGGSYVVGKVELIYRTYEKEVLIYIKSNNTKEFLDNYNLIEIYEVTNYVVGEENGKARIVDLTKYAINGGTLTNEEFAIINENPVNTLIKIHNNIFANSDVSSSKYYYTGNYVSSEDTCLTDTYITINKETKSVTISYENSVFINPYNFNSYGIASKKELEKTTIQCADLRINALTYNSNTEFSTIGKCTVSIPLNDTLRTLLTEGKLKLQLVKRNTKGKKKGNGVRGWAFPKIPFGVGSTTFNNIKNDNSYGVKDFPTNAINPFIDLDLSNISENGKYIISKPIYINEIARCMCYFEDSSNKHLVSAVRSQLSDGHNVLIPAQSLNTNHSFKVVGVKKSAAIKNKVIRFKIALIHSEDHNIYSLSKSTIKLRYIPRREVINPLAPLYGMSVIIE